MRKAASIGLAAVGLTVAASVLLACSGREKQLPGSTPTGSLFSEEQLLQTQTATDSTEASDPRADSTGLTEDMTQGTEASESIQQSQGTEAPENSQQSQETEATESIQQTLSTEATQEQKPSKPDTGGFWGQPDWD